MEYYVHLVREQRTVSAKEGESLLDVLREAGLKPDAPCGGRGLCGKCLVKVNGRTVKACETKVSGAMEVDTMIREEEYQILTKGSARKAVFAPDLKAVRITVPPCPAGESISDWTRITKALEVSDAVNIHAASHLSPLLKKNEGTVWAVVFEERILSVSGEEPKLYMAAFDIGTTTVAAYLMDAATGKEVLISSRKNPQAQYGADVINRANYSLSHGMEEVTGCIRKTVDEMLLEMASEAGIRPEDIYLVSVAGNTCMHHLFLGIAVDSLVHAPYNPVVEESVILPARECDLHIHPQGQLLMLPNIAGFVGADTSACLVASDLASQKEWTLLIDIGTNGEMVLGKDGRMAACSTAAGPAFEGAGISCGMRGAAGAISHAEYKNGKWEYDVIGGQKPRGICGSGLLDVAAQLLIHKKMDSSGKLEEADAVTLVEAKDSGTGEPIRLLQKDIRELQLAKAAIAAGIHLLSEKMEILVKDISQVWIAGAFGSFLSPDSACAIGLIPPELKGRISAIGNAAGEGAKLVLKNKELWKEAQKLARQAEFLELAASPDFQDCYVDELEFPEWE